MWLCLTDSTDRLISDLPGTPVVAVIFLQLQPWNQTVFFILSFSLVSCLEEIGIYFSLTSHSFTPASDIQHILGGLWSSLQLVCLCVSYVSVASVYDFRHLPDAFQRSFLFLHLMCEHHSVSDWSMSQILFPHSTDCIVFCWGICQWKSSISSMVDVQSSNCCKKTKAEEEKGCCFYVL